jgi:hypothetical protein
MRSVRVMAMVHLAANAALLWLGYYWLGVGETRISTLAWSACVAVLLISLTACVYGAPLVFFQGKDYARAPMAWRTALRNLLPLVIAMIGIATIYGLLARWAGYSIRPAFQIASFLTLKLRIAVLPASVARVFNVVLFVVRWGVVPVLVLPMAAAVASQGWTGFRAIGSLVRRWLYWIEVPVLLLCTIWLPLKLLAWVPRLNSFGTETVSFVLRAFVAYLLFGAAWLALAFVTSSGKPRLTQSSTPTSP